MQKSYEYSFTTIWKICAPLHQVWRVMYEQEKWPEWWKGVKKVEVLKDGDENDIGKKMQFTWKSLLPYELSFTMVSTAVKEPLYMEGIAFGELEGEGKWHFKEENGVTTLLYKWDVNTTKKWMNILAPVLKPLFKWNHNIVMKWGAKGLAKRLNADLIEC